MLQLVNAPGYQPVKPAIIAKRLGLVDDGAQEVKKAVRLLVKEKQLAYGPSHQVMAADKKPAQRRRRRKPKTREKKKEKKAARTKATRKEQLPTKKKIISKRTISRNQSRAQELLKR